MKRIFLRHAVVNIDFLSDQTFNISSLEILSRDIFPKYRLNVKLRKLYFLNISHVGWADNVMPTTLVVPVL